MAVDGTSIKNDVDTNLANKGYRGVRVLSVITALKSVIDWVTGAVNGNLTTWNKVGTAGPAGSNTDDVYRTGKVIVGKTYEAYGAALQATTISAETSVTVMSAANPTVDIKMNLVDNVAGQNQNVNFGWLRFFGSVSAPNRFSAIQGNVSAFTDSIGLSFLTLFAGVLGEVGRFASNGYFGLNTLLPSERLHVEGNAYVAGAIKMPTVTANKKISMYDAPNDHQFYGFGVNAGIQRYQVGDTSGAHVFYAGLSPATSKALASILGSGHSDFYGSGRIGGTATPPAGAGLEFHYGAIANTGGIFAYDRTASTYKDLRIDGANIAFNTVNTAGKVGFGTAAPTSSVDIAGTTGHQQLRLETSYTPTGTNDANGAVGQVAWDASYFYIKTAAGWRRTAYGATW